jgi:hypothetical protein
MTHVRIYGPNDRLVTEFGSGGQGRMFSADPLDRLDQFYAIVLDRDSGPQYARGHPYTAICSKFDFNTGRPGEYFSCPFGGRIEMEYKEQNQ